MPYNSSAFEKQLLKHQRAKDVKAIRDMPESRHRPVARASQIEPVRIQSSIDTSDTGPLMGNSYVRQAERPITVQLPPGMIVVQHRKPFYTRLWFIGLALVLAYVFAPQPVKDRLTGAVQHAQVTAASRGVDPLNIRTYSNLMAKDAPAGAAATTAAPMTITPDMHSVIEDAQMRAQSMAAQPGGQSMEAIEKENLRLQEMARDLSKDAHLE